MTRHRSRRAAVAALLLASCAAPALAREPCPDGVFAAEGTPFVTADGAPAGATLALAAGRVELRGLCDAAVDAKVRARRRVDVVKGRWDACAAFPRKVKLVAKVDAADCRRMTGVVRARKATPSKQRFTATRISPAALGLVETLGSAAVAERMRHENFPYLIRPAAEARNPELGALVALGSDAVPALAAEFRAAAGLGDETRLALLAVALELAGDPSVVPVLRDWLEANLFTASLLWAPDLVTHTLKVLHGQDGVDTTLFTYDVDERLDAIARTRLGVAPAAAPRRRARAVRAPATVPRPSNNCGKKIVVTGIDGDGALAEVTIPYATFAKDIDELIADEQDPGTRATLERTRERWRERDEEVYGGTDYVPLPGADVSLEENCGGSVIRRMLNEVARRNGFPVRLGPGNAGADRARELARTFGGPVPIEQLEPLLGMISHDREDGRSAHVEIPIERVDAQTLVVFSKDVQGLARRHAVDVVDAFNRWGPVRDAYNFRPFSNYGTTTTSFAQIDPARVLDVRVDSSACPCGFGGGVGVGLDAPAGDRVDARQVTVSGTVDDAAVTTATLRVNGTARTVAVDGGRFAADVELRTGENDVKVVVEAPDGRRGCVERVVQAPCELTDPADPFNGGGWIRLSVDGGPVIEWRGYAAISLLSVRRAVVWFGAPPTGQPHVLFELYGRRATRPGRFEVRERPLFDDAFTRTYAVGTFRSQPARPGATFRHELVGGTLVVDAFDKGRTRRLAGSFDVTAASTEDGGRARVVGSFDLCRFGIEGRDG